MILEGKIIANRYEILEKVGNGGMAIVYRAKDKVLQRYVAIKILKDEFISDNDFIKRFHAEAQAAASLSHSNIVSVYDVGNENEIYYIVMELIKGKTLKDIIMEEGALPWKWSLNIAMQISSALDTAHKNKIVHRDIKPHNIIITEEGTAKVTDFGIAKAVSNSTITAFSTTMGSVHYFSPEQARGGYTDAKSDIYSLGVVIYEMLTGKVPFDADTPVAIALKHMQEDAIEAIMLNPAIPFSVNKIIVKSMKKDTNLRYESASTMYTDLEQALKNPNGDFVEEDEEKLQYTQAMPDLKNQRIKKEDLEDDIEDEYEEEKPKFKKSLIISLVCIFFIVLGVLTYIFLPKYMNSQKGEEILIPNFVEMTKEDALVLAQELNIELIIEEKYDETVEEGGVISQEPAYMENYYIKENAQITIFLSKGTDTINVPKFVGLTYDETIVEIGENDIEIEIVEENSLTVESGIVFRQSPEANSTIKLGGTVTIYMSKGPSMVNMVYIIGETESTAKSKLEALGLEVEIVYDENTTKSDGVVLKQSVDTNKEIAEGSKVTLTVNKIEASKEGTLNINLKSFLTLIDKADILIDEEGTEVNPTVKVEIKVTSGGVEDTVYSQDHRKDITSLTTKFTGKGNVTVKIFIDGVKEKETTLDLNSSTVLNID